MLTHVARARTIRRHVVARATRVPCLTRRRPQIPTATNLSWSSGKDNGRGALSGRALFFDRSQIEHVEVGTPLVGADSGSTSREIQLGLLRPDRQNYTEFADFRGYVIMSSN